jgi:YHS domain-containing protein
MKTGALLVIALLSAAPAFAHEASPAQAKLHRHAPSSFDKQPKAGTWAKCAVSGDIFQVGEETEFATHDGRVYAFCCPDCKPDFLKNPAKFAGRKKG